MMCLTDKLEQFKRDRAISMHVPGHKNMTIGNLSKLEWTNDMTEIPGLDDLHSPEDVLLGLNDFLSEKWPCYHAQAVVNGTTAGILSAIYAVKDHVDNFLILGDAHKSIYHGLDLAGVRFEEVSPDDLLDSRMENTAMIITYPSYNGTVISGLAELIEHVDHSGGMVIVDEAHGAHFGITAKFPNSALAYGADVVIQSYHKMLPALTGASAVFTKDIAVHKKIMKYIDYFETSSPSYLILASIELAHQFYNDFEDDLFFKKRAQLITGLKAKGFSVKEADDPAKVTVNMEGISPYVLFDAMNEADIYSEMVSDEGVLWCLPLFHEGDGYPLDLLFGRLGALSFSQGSRKDREPEGLDFLIGKTAVRSVVPYPPGVPLVHEGERFTGDAVKSIIHKQSYHVKIEGIQDNIEKYKVDDDG